MQPAITNHNQACPPTPTFIIQLLLTPWAYWARAVLQRSGEAPRRARAALWALSVAWMSGQPEESPLAAGAPGEEVGMVGAGARVGVWAGGGGGVGEPAEGDGRGVKIDQEWDGQRV